MDDFQPTQEKHMNAHRSLRLAGTAALALLAIFLLAETVAVVQNISHPTHSPADTITVSGKGTATAVPDTATVSYTITKTALQIATAQTEATKAENKVLAFLKQQNVSNKDVRTTSYSIRPHYVYRVCVSGVPCSPSKKSGYDVSQSVSVKIRDLSKVGAVLGGLGSAGVSNLSGPNFVVGDSTSVEDQAHAKAIANAKTRAGILAKELGVRLVRIVKYSQTQNNLRSPRPLTYNLSSVVKEGVSVPSVPVGENTYTANVAITYEIW